MAFLDPSIATVGFGPCFLDQRYVNFTFYVLRCGKKGFITIKRQKVIDRYFLDFSTDIQFDDIKALVVQTVAILGDQDLFKGLQVVFLKQLDSRSKGSTLIKLRANNVSFGRLAEQNSGL
jgi:hypothetical protein